MTIGLRAAVPPTSCVSLPDGDDGGDTPAHPRITARLKQAGYAEADPANMWNGNVLRILSKTQFAAGFAASSM